MGHAILTKQEDKNPKIPSCFNNVCIPPTFAMYVYWNTPLCLDNIGLSVTLSMYFHWNILHPYWKNVQIRVLLFMYFYLNIPHPCLDNVRIPVILSLYFHWKIPYPCLNNVWIAVTLGGRGGGMHFTRTIRSGSLIYFSLVHLGWRIFPLGQTFYQSYNFLAFYVLAWMSFKDSKRRWSPN